RRARQPLVPRGVVRGRGARSVVVSLLVGAVQELGSVVGPVFGAAILAVSGWRAIFWANAVAGVVLYAVIRALGRRASVRGGGGRRGIRTRLLGAWTLGAAGIALGTLALAAPQRLVTDVTLGAPFVPFSGDSRALTPIGAVAAALLLGATALTVPQWWPVLRRADLVGATLVTVSLGCLVLAFASADPERELVGALGRVLLPVGGLTLLGYGWWHRRARQPLVPRGVVRGRGARSVVVSLLVGVSLVAVVVDVPLLARLTGSYDETGAALVLVRFLVAVPVGAAVGGVALRRVGAGAVAGAGLLAASAGLFVMSGWSLHSVEQPLATTVVLALVGLGVGLALAPVNDAVLADSPVGAHGVASSLVVVARMVGMVVGLALLTSVGLSRYFEAVRRLPNPLDPGALVAAGVVQIQTVFLGGAVAALLAGLLALTLGLTPDTRGRVSP
ncbi:MAG TPA: MFS transporter, partial [Intrasporangium sp.]|uniref:MFS transporter n=1 Tax=Intrasporangium sp. TaxID=1925024 RepID=UPI002D798A52